MDSLKNLALLTKELGNSLAVTDPLRSGSRLTTPVRYCRVGGGGRPEVSSTALTEQ